MEHFEETLKGQRHLKRSKEVVQYKIIDLLLLHVGFKKTRTDTITAHTNEFVNILVQFDFYVCLMGIHTSFSYT